MRIGIDISQIVYGTGVSNYTRNLVAALLKIDKRSLDLRSKKNNYVLFGGSLRRLKGLKDFHAGLSGDSTLKTFPVPPMIADFLWNKLHMFPVENLIGNVDVFHSSDWTQPPTRAFKVTTIHDLVPLRFPEISSPKIVAVHKRRLEWVKKEVDKIIAVSEFTKKEILELLDIPSEKIVVIPEAPTRDGKQVSKKEIERVKRKNKIKKNYLLVVGADQRKNIPAVIQAFDRLKHKDLSLVIVGRLWEDVPRVKNVILLGHTSLDDLQALYSGAETLVYTSLYEGFGLPILEAMQAGCPVVTSNIGSMKEVAGDAAVLVDPTNPTQIADGIDEILSKRSDWIKKGRERAREFSWEKTAQATLNIYKEALR